MSNKILLAKLKAYKKYINKFIIFNRNDVEDIHDLRIKSRELYSLLSSSDPFCKPLKKVIKLSNKIRDLDVFHQDYLGELPKKYLSKTEKKVTKKLENEKRDKKLHKLLEYLKLLVVPQSAVFKDLTEKPKSLNIDKLSLDQKSLHKFRAYIKKRLYIEKNTLPLNKKRVENFTEIKDILGTINDNINGLNKLSSYSDKPLHYDKIQKYTQKVNIKLFKRFKRMYKENNE